MMYCIKELRETIWFLFQRCILLKTPEFMQNEVNCHRRLLCIRTESFSYDENKENFIEKMNR